MLLTLLQKESLTKGVTDFTCFTGHHRSCDGPFAVQKESLTLPALLQFCINGLVFPDRKFHPGCAEVYVYIYIYVYTYIYNIYTNIYMDMYMYTYTHIYRYTNFHVYIHIYMYIRIYICMYIYLCTHI
jgi:hypothetical protein